MLNISEIFERRFILIPGFSLDFSFIPQMDRWYYHFIKQKTLWTRIILVTDYLSLFSFKKIGAL